MHGVSICFKIGYRSCTCAYSFFKKVTVGMRLDIKLAILFKVMLS